MRRFLLAIPLVMLMTPIQASDEERASAMMRSLAPWDQVYFDLVARERAAQSVWEYWDHFNSRLPRISPEERTWLQRELDTTDTQRISRAIASETYNLWSLELVVDACLEDSKGILDNIGDELEMYYWVRLGTCFDEHSELNRSLQAVGLSNGRYDGPFFLMPLNIMHDAILRRIAPSAMADVMGWTLD